MIGYDAATESAIIAAGGTTGSFTHTPLVAAPKAVVVLTAQRTANEEGVTKVEYGGVAMERIKKNIAGATAGTQIWFLKIPPSGAQTVKVTKTSGVNVRALAVTVLADGEVVVDASSGGNGTSATPATSVAATTTGLGLAICASAQGAAPTARSQQALIGQIDGEADFDAQWSRYRAAESPNHTWTYPESTAYACCAVLLRDPNPTTFNASFESGNISQFFPSQTVVGAQSVAANSAASGVPGYRGTFILEEGQTDPQLNLAISELVSGLHFNEGDQFWMHDFFRIDSYDPTHWMLVWELHQEGGEGSPPIALYTTEKEGKPILRLQQGEAKALYWEIPMPLLGRWHEIVIRVKVSMESGEVEVPFFDGHPQTMLNGKSVVTGANTLQVAPAYDKVGIYRDKAALGTAQVCHRGYKVQKSAISIPGVML